MRTKFNEATNCSGGIFLGSRVQVSRERAEKDKEGSWTRPQDESDKAPPLRRPGTL